MVIVLIQGGADVGQGGGEGQQGERQGRRWKEATPPREKERKMGRRQRTSGKNSRTMKEDRSDRRHPETGPTKQTAQGNRAGKGRKFVSIRSPSPHGGSIMEAMT